MMRVLAPILICAIAILTGVTASIGGAPKRSDNPALIPWHDALEVALAQSRTNGKPLLAILQDTPNCANCQSFQRDITQPPAS